MKKEKLKILKTILTKIIGFNSKSISDTFLTMGLVFFGALLGGVVSITLIKDPTSVKTWLILIVSFLVLSMLFGVITQRQLLKELIEKFKQS